MALKRPPPPPPTTDLVPGESPEDVHPIRLARILAEKWADMSENTREVVLEELAEGGVVAVKATTKVSQQQSEVERFVALAASSEDEAELKMEILRTQMRMADGRFNGPLRLVEMLSLLSDLAGHAQGMGDMLATVWSAWQSLAKNKRIGPSAPSRRHLMEHLREYLHSGPSHSELAPALKDQMAAARLLIAILSGLGQGSQRFAQDFYRHLDPDKIHQELRQARGGKAPSAEDLWNRYKQLSDALTPSEIEDLLLKRIIEAAEVFFHAAHRG